MADTFLIGLGLLTILGYALVYLFIIGVILWILFEFAGFIIKAVWYGFLFCLFMGTVIWILS